MPFSFLLLQTASAPTNSFYAQALVFGSMFAIFYLLIFMPMRRQQRNQKEMLKALQNGQTVVTSGGIIGTVVTVNDDTLILRIKPDNLRLQVARSSVTSVVGADDQAKKS